MHAGTSQQLPDQASLPNQLPEPQSQQQPQLPEAEVAGFGTAPNQACAAATLKLLSLAAHHRISLDVLSNTASLGWKTWSPSSEFI